jgi:hypothetical protein
LDKLKADKLDNLFREKLQDCEISPEENYWPYLEKSLDKLSFFKFGWEHINIYNTSVGLLAIILPTIYFFNQPSESKSDKTSPSFSDTSSVTNKSEESAHSTFVKPVVSNEEAVSETKKKKTKKGDKPEISSFPELNNEVKDSNENKIKETPVVEMPEPVKVVEEKPKTKPKRIIYVVEQDTIIQKDTVKVRRKRKN